jgi:mRNA interferase MazF
VDVVVRRAEVWLVALNPIRGSEMGKSRPCVIVSPDEANRHLRTVTIVPLTSTLRTYPTRIDCTVDGKSGQMALDQIRTVDKDRLIRPLGRLEEATCRVLFRTLVEYFRY